MTDPESLTQTLLLDDNSNDEDNINDEDTAQDVNEEYDPNTTEGSHTPSVTLLLLITLLSGVQVVESSCRAGGSTRTTSKPPFIGWV